jgi:hypothetical protein
VEDAVPAPRDCTGIAHPLRQFARANEDHIEVAGKGVGQSRQIRRTREFTDEVEIGAVCDVVAEDR